jgi:hypothetical protein
MSESWMVMQLYKAADLSAQTNRPVELTATRRSYARHHTGVVSKLWRRATGDAIPGERGGDGPWRADLTFLIDPDRSVV